MKKFKIEDKQEKKSLVWLKISFISTFLVTLGVVAYIYGNAS